MKRNRSIDNRTMARRVIEQAVGGAIGGAFMGTLFAMIVDSKLLPPVYFWAVSGAVFSALMSLAKDSLWTRITGINISIILVTFAVSLPVMEIDYADSSGIMPFLVIAGVAMAIVTSFLVIRPVQLLTKTTQSMRQHNLSERVPVDGPREIRALAQSFNGMAEALALAETHRQQLLADVAHELRTPLTVLKSNLRAILDDVHEPDKEQLLTLYSQTRQLNHLVDDLHDLAQADAHQLPLDKTEIDMNALVEQAGELFEPLASEAGLTPHTSTPKQKVIVLGDRNRLIQVLQNLLGNGLRHAHSRLDLRLWLAACRRDGFSPNSI